MDNNWFYANRWRWATATLLLTGQVLVVHSETAELYDPIFGVWSPTGSPTTARSFQTASLLQSGQVLIAGGLSTTGVSAALELYDAGSGVFTPAGNMSTPRYGHTATVLASGQVLLAGGFDKWVAESYPAVSSAEVYDPSSHQVNPAPSMNVGRARYTATLLQNGQVLVAGGTLNTDGNGGGTPTATSEIYTP